MAITAAFAAVFIQSGNASDYSSLNPHIGCGGGVRMEKGSMTTPLPRAPFVEKLAPQPQLERKHVGW